MQAPVSLLCAAGRRACDPSSVAILVSFLNVAFTLGVYLSQLFWHVKLQWVEEIHDYPALLSILSRPHCVDPRVRDISQPEEGKAG